jgi:hypothetical protein
MISHLSILHTTYTHAAWVSPCYTLLTLLFLFYPIVACFQTPEAGAPLWENIPRLQEAFYLRIDFA